MKGEEGVVEDALHACRARGRGHPPGGGRPPRPQGPRKLRRRPKTMSESASTSSTALAAPVKQIAANCGPDGRSYQQRRGVQRDQLLATTPSPTSTATCSRWASSSPTKVERVVPSRTPPPSLAALLTTEAAIVETTPKKVSGRRPLA